MQKNPVCYYYKDVKTGVEMSFSKHPDWGWAVGFHNIDFEGSLDYRGNIPWSELTEAEKLVVDENYKKLYKMMEEGDRSSGI